MMMTSSLLPRPRRVNVAPPPSPRQYQIMLIEARLKEAARILKRLPDQDAKFLARIQAMWPDFKPEAFDKWVGYKREKVRAPRLPATAAQITRTDTCLFIWLHWLAPAVCQEDVPVDLPQIVMARAAGCSWRGIGRMRRTIGRDRGGNSHVSLRKLYRHGIGIIADRLENRGRPLEVPLDWER